MEPEAAAQFNDQMIDLDDGNDEDDDGEDAVDELEQLRAQFPNAASDAQQAVLRQQLKGSLVELLFSKMDDEAFLESCKQANITFDLPADLLAEVMTRDDTWRLRTPRYLPLVLTSWTRDLVICCAERRAMARGWTKEDLDQLVKLICTICKDSLQKLTIHNASNGSEQPFVDSELWRNVDSERCPNMDTEQLNTLLNGVTSLDQLHVEAIDQENTFILSPIVTDTTLKIIAEKHKKIRSLPFPYSLYTTLAGLNHVLDNCKDLEDFSIGSFAKKTFRTVILNVPTLKSISTSKPSFLVDCVREIALERDPEEPPFLLRGDVAVVGTVEEFKQVLKVFPNLSFSFEYKSDPGFYDALMEHRTELCKLEVLECHLSQVPQAELMQHFSNSLTSLHLNRNSGEVDVARIGYYCTNLKDLQVGGKLVASPEYINMLEAHHFAALEELSLNKFDYIPLMAPDALLVRLLGGEKLRHAELRNVNVSDSAALRLEEEARGEGKALSSLQVFHVGTSYDAGAIVRIAINAPKLRVLQTFYTDSILTQFITSFNRKLKVLSNIYRPPRNPCFF